VSKRPRTVVYTRLSERGDNHPLQEADCRKQASRDGVPESDIEVLSETGSAWNEDRHREVFEEILRRGMAGGLDRIYAWKLDRLCRQMDDLVRLEKLIQKHGVEIRFADGSRFETGMGAAVAYFGVLAARHESDVKSQRVKRKLQDNAEKGLPNGRLSWGLRDEEQRALIREAAQRVTAGETLHAIARDWNERGVRGTGGSLWNGSRISRILRRPQIAGHSVLNGEIVGRGQWEPALSEMEWKRVLRVLDGRRGGPSGPREPALLSGLVYCECGYRMTTRKHASGYRMHTCYRSPNRQDPCGKVSIACSRLDEEVSARFLTVLQESRHALAVAGASGRDAERAKLLEDLEADRELLADLDYDRYERRSIDRETYLRLRTPIEERIQKAEHALEVMDAPALDVPSPEEILAAWDGASEGERRGWLRAYIDRVAVKAAPKGTSGRIFDPARVELRWLR